MILFKLLFCEKIQASYQHLTSCILQTLAALIRFFKFRKGANMIDIKCEKTKDGWQYVLPGAERVRPKKAKRYSFETDLIGGKEQFVIPGAEQECLRVILERKCNTPFRPRKYQKSLHGTPLFL